jgi:uncharacterized OB-fold protein
MGDEPGRPLPRASELTSPHWSACGEGKLLFQECSACGQAVFPPQEFCPGELTETLRWKQSRGIGVVYSHTTIWRPQTPAFEVPYIVGDIELSEGFHMLTNIVDCAPDTVYVGMPVRVSFRPVGRAVLPFFEPAD